MIYDTYKEECEAANATQRLDTSLQYFSVMTEAVDLLRGLVTQTIRLLIRLEDEVIAEVSVSLPSLICPRQRSCPGFPISKAYIGVVELFRFFVKDITVVIRSA